MWMAALTRGLDVELKSDQMSVKCREMEKDLSAGNCREASWEELWHYMSEKNRLYLRSLCCIMIK